VATPYGPYLPHVAFVKIFTLSWRLKGGTFHPCLSFLAFF
jgi:hypothetical protein